MQQLSLSLKSSQRLDLPTAFLMSTGLLSNFQLSQPIANSAASVLFLIALASSLKGGKGLLAVKRPSKKVYLQLRHRP